MVGELSEESICSNGPDASPDDEGRRAWYAGGGFAMNRGRVLGSTMICVTRLTVSFSAQRTARDNQPPNG